MPTTVTAPTKARDSALCPPMFTNKTACKLSLAVTTTHLLFSSPLFTSVFSPSISSLTNLHFQPSSVLQRDTMAAITETKRSYLPRFPSTKTSLPLSHTDSPTDGGVLRRRLSSISLSLKPMSTSTASWAIRRSKSVSSAGAQAGSSIRTWWDSVWAWVLSRKPLFARDLELNEEETKMLGSQSRGSWRHVFYKVRGEIRRLVGSDHVGLPQTCRYDSYSYAKNFDEGKSFRSY